MKQADLERIELELGIKLPKPYRQAMESFPVPAYAGNTDTYLWDDANQLIEENRQLRKGGKHLDPWPETFYCLGRAGGGDVYAMDLSDRDARVYWADHSHLDVAGGGEDAPSFSEWLATYVDDTRQDLEGDGVDPDGSPERRAEVEERSFREGCWGCLVLAVVAGALLALLRLIL